MSATHRPGPAPAPGLRAGSDGVGIVTQTIATKELPPMFWFPVRARHPRRSSRPARWHLCVERLENRLVPSTWVEQGPGSGRKLPISSRSTGETRNRNNHESNTFGR
jgi:hypothetical protein